MTATFDVTAGALDAVNWRTLDFDPDAATAALALPLQGGLAGADISGVITAFGLYSDLAGTSGSGGGSRRFSGYMIEAVPVPEPSTWVLAVIGAMGMAVAARRRVKKT